MSEQFRREREVPEEIDLAASEFMRLYYNDYNTNVGIDLLKAYMKPEFYYGENVHLYFLKKTSVYVGYDIAKLHNDFTKIVHEYVVDPQALRQEIACRLIN